MCVINDCIYFSFQFPQYMASFPMDKSGLISSQNLKVCLVPAIKSVGNNLKMKMHSQWEAGFLLPCEAP